MGQIHEVIQEIESFAAGSFKTPRGLPFFDWDELKHWTFYRAVATEFGGTMVLIYISLSVYISNKESMTSGIGILGTSWAFGGVVIVIVYCIGGISGGHINPAITFGLLLLKKLTFPCFLLFAIAQISGAITGAGLVKLRQKSFFNAAQGGANFVSHGYTKGGALLAEIMGAFVIMCTVSAALDPKRKARDAHVPALTPIPIGLAGFVVHLATIPIDGCGVNPARSIGPAVIYNNSKVWSELWIFLVGPVIGACLGALCHYVTNWFHPKKLVKSYGEDSETSSSPANSTTDKLTEDLV